MLEIMSDWEKFEKERFLSSLRNAFVNYFYPGKIWFIEVLDFDEFKLFFWITMRKNLKKIKSLWEISSIQMLYFKTSIIFYSLYFSSFEILKGA